MTTVTVNIKFNSPTGEDREITYETDASVDAIDAINDAGDCMPPGSIATEITMRRGGE